MYKSILNFHHVFPNKAYVSIPGNLSASFASSLKIPIKTSENYQTKSASAFYLTYWSK